MDDACREPNNKRMTATQRADLKRTLKLVALMSIVATMPANLRANEKDNTECTAERTTNE